MDAEKSPVDPADQLTPNLPTVFEAQSSAAIAGNQAARAEILQTCREYLLFIANQELDARLRDKCGASDLVQNVMVKAIENFEAFQGKDRRAFLAWVRQILKRELVDARRTYLEAGKRDVRKERRVPDQPDARLGLVDPQQTPATRVALADDIDQLRQALAKLSREHEAVIQMRNWERLSFAEIGERMGRSADAAKKLWARALHRLNEALASDDETDKPQR